jgi:hypothetical protein
MRFEPTRVALESCVWAEYVFSMKSSHAALLFFFFLPGTAVTSARSQNPTTVRGAFIDIGGQRLHYEECGPGPDAVVLIHDGVVKSPFGMMSGERETERCRKAREQSTKRAIAQTHGCAQEKQKTKTKRS